MLYLFINGLYDNAEVSVMAKSLSKYLGYGMFCLGIMMMVLVDPMKIQLWIQQCGLLAPICFLFLQIIQVIIPVIPGPLSCVMGVVLFGPIEGFIFNYIGSMLGSIIAFVMVKRYGYELILKFISRDTYERYIGWISKGKKFDILFTLAILIPGFPDDLLCMIAALTPMSLKKFIVIIGLSKPFSFMMYSVGMNCMMM